MGLLIIINVIKGMAKYKKEEYTRADSDDSWFFIGENWWW
jgi:hypothetical protein